MDYGLHVRSYPVDLAVDESLQIRAPAFCVDRVSLEIEFHDVGGGDRRRRDASREQEAVRVSIVPDADMAEAVDHAFAVQDMVRAHQVFDQDRVRRPPRCWSAGTLDGAHRADRFDEYMRLFPNRSAMLIVTVTAVSHSAAFDEDRVI